MFALPKHTGPDKNFVEFGWEQNKAKPCCPPGLALHLVGGLLFSFQVALALNRVDGSDMVRPQIAVFQECG